MRIVGPALTRRASEAGTALFASRNSPQGNVPAGMSAADALGQFSAFLFSDAGLALSHLASPAFAAVMVVNAASFGLLVWHRQRSA